MRCLIVCEYIPFIGLNTHGGVIFATRNCAYVWTIKGYFGNHRQFAEEVAVLDGATPQVAFRLVLPLSVPILAVVFILSFIAAITEVPVASLLLRDVNSYTPGRGCSTPTRKTTCG